MSTHIGADDDTTPKTIEWHPALGGAIRERPVLAEAMMNDGQLVHHLQLLSLFLTALDKHETAWASTDEWLPVKLVDDLVPSDRELIEQATRRAAAIRALEEGAYTTVDALATSLGFSAGGIDAMVKPPAVVGVEPCPECVQGKCGNCTGQTMGPDDAHVTCHLDTMGHHGVHRQADECIMPVTA